MLSLGKILKHFAVAMQFTWGVLYLHEERERDWKSDNNVGKLLAWAIFRTEPFQFCALSMLCCCCCCFSCRYLPTYKYLNTTFIKVQTKLLCSANLVLLLFVNYFCWSSRHDTYFYKFRLILILQNEVILTPKIISSLSLTWCMEVLASPT